MAYVRRPWYATRAQSSKHRLQSCLAVAFVVARTMWLFSETFISGKYAATSAVSSTWAELNYRGICFCAERKVRWPRDSLALFFPQRRESRLRFSAARWAVQSYVRSIDRVISHEARGCRVGQFCPILERPNHQECTSFKPMKAFSFILRQCFKWKRFSGLLREPRSDSSPGVK